MCPNLFDANSMITCSPLVDVEGVNLQFFEESKRDFLFLERSNGDDEDPLLSSIGIGRYPCQDHEE